MISVNGAVSTMRAPPRAAPLTGVEELVAVCISANTVKQGYAEVNNGSAEREKSGTEWFQVHRG